MTFNISRKQWEKRQEVFESSAKSDGLFEIIGLFFFLLLNAVVTELAVTMSHDFSMADNHRLFSNDNTASV